MGRNGKKAQTHKRPSDRKGGKVEETTRKRMDGVTRGRELTKMNTRRDIEITVGETPEQGTHGH